MKEISICLILFIFIACTSDVKKDSSVSSQLPEPKTTEVQNEEEIELLK